MTENLRNLGPVSAKWLADIGIHTHDDLKRTGSVNAYAMVCRQQPKASLNLLWALEAAQRDIDWRNLTEEDKNALKAELRKMCD